jgi:Mycoplasma protein of unknown function, DUF285
MSSQEEGEQNEEDRSSSPLFGSERGTFSPARQFGPDGSYNKNHDENTQSFVTQAALVGVISILIITLSTLALMVQISSSSTTKMEYGGVGQSSLLAIDSPKSNLLGLYYAIIPNQYLPPSSTALLSVSSSQQQQDQHPSLEEEAFFLRYLVMPLEPGESDQAKKNFPTKNDGGSSSMISTTSKTQLMRPRGRLLQTVKALQKEMQVTAKEDFLQPLVQKWTGRFDAVKERLHFPNKKNDKDTMKHDVGVGTSQSQAFFSLSPPTTQGVLYPGSIFGIYPMLDAPHQKDDARHWIGTNNGRKNQPKTFAPRHTVNRPSSTTTGVNKGKTSVCPTNVLCYYTIPPTTNGKKDVICASYCRRCFETTPELYEAIQSYLDDPSNHTSHVATTYGWPIRNWCTSLIANYTGLFANTAFNDDISSWDMSSATSMRSMFENATAFNQPLATWDVSHVQDMSYLFAGALSFNQNLHTWNVRRVQDVSHAFDGATLLESHEHDIFDAWAHQSNQTSLLLGREQEDNNQAAEQFGTELQMYGGSNLSGAPKNS